MEFVKKNLIYIIILVIGVGGMAFGGYSLYKSGKSDQSSQNNSGNNQPAFNDGNNGQNFGRGNRGNFQPPVQGTILSVDASKQTLVMTLSDSSTKNISASSDTRISEQPNGTRTTLNFSDLKVGDKINVMSSDQSADPVIARMIFIGDFTPGGNRGSSQNQEQSSSGSGSSSSI